MALNQAQLDAIKRIQGKSQGIIPSNEVSNEQARKLLNFESVSQQVEEKENGFFTRLGNDITKRADAITEGAKKGFGLAKEAFQARKEQPAVETGIQMAGGVAQVVVTPIIESIGSLFDVVKEATPEEVKKPVVDSIKKALNIVATKGPQWFSPEEAKVAMDKYNEAVARDPSIKRDLEASANLFAAAFSLKDIQEGVQGLSQLTKTTKELPGKISTFGSDATSKISGSVKNTVSGVKEKLPNFVDTGTKTAKDIIPTKKEVISGQITKALDLTQGDVSNIKLSSGNEVGEWIANKNIIGGNKKETLDNIKKVVDTQYKAVREEISKVPTIYTPETAPRVKEALTELEQSTKGILGLEKVNSEIVELSKKSQYTLNDIQRVKELVDDQFDLYKATGDVKAGQAKAGLANVRRDLKTFIEKEVENTTGAKISQLNNDVSTGQSILKLANKRATRDFTRANLSLSDWGIFGSGSVVGTPLTGMAAVITKRIIETPTVRLKIAKFLNSLPKKEVEVIKNELLRGNVPNKVKKIVGDFKEATVPETVFERAKNLSPQNRNIESKAFDIIKSNGDKILSQYTQKHGKIVNADNFRPFFKEIGYAGHNAAAVQEPSSFLAKKAFTEGLKNEGKYATIYAGGSGTGKTSAVKGLSSINEVLKDSSVVLDGNLSSYNSAIKKISEAANAGKQTPIIYVYRDPADSLVNGVVKRMKRNVEEMGRLVPTKVVAENHIGSWETIKRLYNEGFPVYFVDNSLGANKAVQSSFEELSKKIKYPSKEKLTDIFNKEVKKLYESGEINKNEYEGYIK